ncbi:hypothetical protein PUN28_011363 [Cardiocondyla obscurior]|uniref:Ribosomal protein L20 n=1 Tax=Cardiocondyla obscurior TaxID=286306 RepID=A0AAW2FGT8_9HYME
MIKAKRNTSQKRSERVSHHLRMRTFRCKIFLARNLALRIYIFTAHNAWRKVSSSAHMTPAHILTERERERERENFILQSTACIFIANARLCVREIAIGREVPGNIRNLRIPATVLRARVFALARVDVSCIRVPAAARTWARTRFAVCARIRDAYGTLSS